MRAGEERAELFSLLLFPTDVVSSFIFQIDEADIGCVFISPRPSRRFILPCSAGEDRYDSQRSGLAARNGAAPCALEHFHKL